MAVCEVGGCGRPVEQIKSGHGFCARHGEGDLYPEVAIVGCKVCGTAVPHAGVLFWDIHANWPGRNGVPPRAA